jgi:acetyltransferase-like isoleucine patch superfamily enzyme
VLDWWLRGLRLLRYPALVRGLGELKAEWEMLETIRAAYSDLGVRIHRQAVFENWAPQKLNLGRGTTIERGTILCWGAAADDGGLIAIGEGTWVGPYNNFRTAEAGVIRIGRGCLISQFCSFVSHNHGIDRHRTIAEQAANSQTTDVTVGDDVWFGVDCAVLPGVVIGTGAVVGAGSVVTRAVGPYEIWAGAPARKIGERE